MREMSQKTLDVLFQLITKPRKDASDVPMTNSYKWNQIKPQNIIRSDAPDSQLDTLMPLHDFVKLNSWFLSNRKISKG